MTADIRTKEDVSFHSEGFGDSRPAVNVKVYDTIWSVKLPQPLGAVSDDGGKTWRSVSTDPEFTHAWIEENVSESQLEAAWEWACRDGWDMLEEQAEEIYGPGVKVYSEGRSGGWAVVEGGSFSPDVEGWDAIALSRWRRFAKRARELADDTPWRMLDGIYANFYEFEQEETAEAARAADHNIPTVLMSR